jgi:uncharacterized protein YjiS (DUF1127 family)
MAIANSTRAAGGSFSDRVTDLSKQFRAAVARRRTYAQTYRELSGLTDRELADLGMHRSDIAAIARQAAYGN